VAEATDSKTDVESPMPPLEGELLRPGKAIKADSARLPAHVRTPARKWHRWCFALVAVVGAAGGGYYWRRAHVPALPAGIVVANGRLEAEQIDISTKFAGRVAELRVAEGDEVQGGQVVARMDTRDLEATLNKDIAQQRAAERAIVHAGKGAAKSPATDAAFDALMRCRASQRRFRNTLLFVAPDETQLGNAREVMRKALAWKSIVEDSRIQQQLTQGPATDAVFTRPES
jgi:multidrug efflux pump subunit AcrA (membrane-fusion protein)